MRSAKDKRKLEKMMREGWDGAAHGDWRHSICAEASDSEKSFRASGERDYKKYIGQFLSSVRIDPGELVALEIGCGAGRVSEFLARDFQRLVALDISREMLKIGRRRVKAKNILWLCSDGKCLRTFADQSVDFIFSLAVFQQIPDAETVMDYIEDAGRVLKPGGWFIFQVMNHPHLSAGSWTIAVFVSRKFHLPRIRIYKPDVLDAGPIRIGFVRRSCADSGLKIVRIVRRFNQNTWIWSRKIG